MSTAEAAKLVEVSVQSVANWINQGLLKAGKTPGGHRRIQVEHLVQFLREQNMRIPEELPQTEHSILIVDDEPAVAQYLAQEMAMRFPKASVLVANDGYAAGELVVSHRPRIVILDLMMPGMDGFAVCQRIKADSRNSETCVIAVTAHANAEVAKRILSAGAIECLSKPVDIDRLEELVRKAMD